MPCVQLAVLAVVFADNVAAESTCVRDSCVLYVLEPASVRRLSADQVLEALGQTRRHVLLVSVRDEGTARNRRA